MDFENLIALQNTNLKIDDLVRQIKNIKSVRQMQKLNLEAVTKAFCDRKDDTEHDHCPVWSIAGGLRKIHEADEEVKEWIDGLPFTL